MELHVLGPAFRVPSLDPDCIAAALYLHHLLPPEQWVLVAAHDTSLSPTGEFPLLIDGPNRISSFASIVDYLHTEHHQSLDTNLFRSQRADLIALKSHLTHHALPLIDLTLYTSPTNYSTHIRPAHIAILPRLTATALASTRLASATTRTAPLGLTTAPSSADSSTNASTQPAGSTPQEQQEAAMNSMASGAPSLLFKRRRAGGLAAELKARQSMARWRVEAVVEEVCAPIEGLLQSNAHGYLLGEELTSLDCAVFGYFSLLLWSGWEDAWVGEVVETRYKSVAEYIERLREELLGRGELGVVDIEAVMRAPRLPASPSDEPVTSTAPQDTTDTTRTAASLPWRRPAAQGSTLSTLATTIRNFPTSIILPSLLTPARRLHLLGASTLFFASPSSPLRTYLDRELLISSSSLTSRLLIPSILTLSAAAAAAFATLFLPPNISLPFSWPFVDLLAYLRTLRPEGLGEQVKTFSRPPASRTGLSGLGEAGAMLFGGIYGFDGPGNGAERRAPHFLDDDFDWRGVEGHGYMVKDDVSGGAEFERDVQDGGSFGGGDAVGGGGGVGVDVEVEV